ncbi:unnamed protein product [Trichogramma brassicae]|uniref:CCHC-type domain-containing protein n=1 Tax=Trichogramma brassicae TaxID=86971 RepID=A0A6H5I007_9HYME|nr:unnamed protein product [Trichogramma brassicae]
MEQIKSYMLQLEAERGDQYRARANQVSTYSRRDEPLRQERPREDHQRGYQRDYQREWRERQRDYQRDQQKDNDHDYQRDNDNNYQRDYQRPEANQREYHRPEAKTDQHCFRCNDREAGHWARDCPLAATNQWYCYVCMDVRNHKGNDCPNSVQRDPTSYREAMSSTESTEWQRAVEDELKSMEENEVWELVSKSDLHKKNKRPNIIDSRWIFKRKKAEDNSEKFKARLVIRGFKDKNEYQLLETYAPVSRMTVIRAALAIINKFDLEVVQLDVKTAFLNGVLEEEFKVDLEPCKKKAEAEVHAALEEILNDVTAKVKEVYRELKHEAKEAMNRPETGISEAKKGLLEVATAIYETGKSVGSFVLEGITLPATAEVLVKNTQKKVASRTASIERDAQRCVLEAVKAAGVDTSGLEGNEVEVELAEGPVGWARRCCCHRSFPRLDRPLRWSGPARQKRVEISERARITRTRNVTMAMAYVSQGEPSVGGPVGYLGGRGHEDRARSGRRRRGSRRGRLGAGRRRTAPGYAASEARRSDGRAGAAAHCDKTTWTIIIIAKTASIYSIGWQVVNSATHWNFRRATSSEDRCPAAWSRRPDLFDRRRSTRRRSARPYYRLAGASS